MKIITTSLFVGTLVSATASYGEKAVPEFSHYKVEATDTFKGAPAPVDFTSHKGAEKYKTKLMEGEKKGPNFAGHYTVVTYGCGTQCQDNWVIDVKTGQIIDRFESVIAPKYALDSSLLIINPPDADLKKAYKEHPEQPLLGTLETTYKVIKDGKIEVIHRAKWVDIQ